MSKFQEISMNHLAFTVGHPTLSTDGRAQILDFFKGCLDFTQASSKPENLLMVHARPDLDKWDFGATYVVFIGKEKPEAVKPGRGGNHIGISCSSLDQFEVYLERTTKYLAKYGITENIDVERFQNTGAPTDQPRLHGFYVRPFDLPISIEVQFRDRDGS